MRKNNDKSCINCRYCCYSEKNNRKCSVCAVSAYSKPMWRRRTLFQRVIDRIEGRRI